MIKNENLLKEIGLTNWETQTYLALLELGSSTTGPIVKKSEVPQSKIYGVLESLRQKDLVNYIIKGKTKYFQSSEPQKILSLFKAKEKKVTSLLQELKLKQTQPKQSTELFEGVKSIRNMLYSLTENAKTNENWYGFSTGETSIDKEIEEFYEWWGIRKESVKFKDHLLISFQNKKLFEQSASKPALDYMKEKNILRYNKVSFPGDVAIFRNHVIIFNWENTPTAILITSENLSEQYKNFFLDFWKTSTQ
jgi:sugar-specific transcriptional regulator TrmB